MTDAAALLGALGVAGVLLARRRLELAGGLAALGIATAVLAVDQGGSVGADSLLDSGGLAAAAAVAGVLLLALAALLVRLPVAVVPLLLVAAPLRLPLAADRRNDFVLGLAGTGGAGRLYPFYAVLGATVIALLWRLARGQELRPIPGLIAVPAAALMGLVSVSLLWSRDVAAGADQLVFFWFPFTALVAVVAQSRLSGRARTAAAVTLVAEAAAFALLGVWQAITERLIFFTVALERANDLGPLFRVTSAFQDPNHYGRHIVLAIGILLVALWLGRARAWLSAALVAVLAAGLYFSYSQSSFVALIVVALAVALAAGDRPVRRTVAVAGACIAVAGIVTLAVTFTGGSTASVTSERSTLAGDTAAVFVRHPLAGVGVGAQPRITRDEQAPGTPKVQNTSHTTPLAVAAELGVLGIAAYLMLVGGAVLALKALADRDRLLALGIAAVLIGLAVHSLFYPGFFENPITFGALGAIAAGLTQGVRNESDGSRPHRWPLGAMRSWRGMWALRATLERRLSGSR